MKSPFRKKQPAEPAPESAESLAGPETATDPADPLTVELSSLSPLATHIVILATHGGQMNHMDIVKRLPPHSDQELAEAFLQCRKSYLLYDTQPTAFRPVHSWLISPYWLPQLQAWLNS